MSSGWGVEWYRVGMTAFVGQVESGGGNRVMTGLEACTAALGVVYRVRLGVGLRR
jgi:hypothetical protein